MGSDDDPHFSALVYGAENVVTNWDITSVEREFLLRTGLPRSVPPFLEMILQDEENPTVSSVSHGMLYKVGWDMGKDIGIASKGRGVYAVEPDQEEEDCFVNSSLTHFGQFVHRVLRFQMDSLAGRREKERASAELDADLLWQELSKIDPAAFDDGWWSLVLEQMGHGLI